MLESLNNIQRQSPALGEDRFDVKVILLLFVPWAINSPFTWSDFSLSNFMVTPGSIVKVTFSSTRMLFVTI